MARLARRPAAPSTAADIGASPFTDGERRAIASLVARAKTTAPGCYVVVFRHHDGSLEGRLRETRRAWGVTPRECDVLRWLAGGDAGKEIATRLGITERVVERHVTCILRKASCDSRGRLIAKFWSGL